MSYYTQLPLSFFRKFCPFDFFGEKLLDSFSGSGYYFRFAVWMADPVFIDLILTLYADGNRINRWAVKVSV